MFIECLHHGLHFGSGPGELLLRKERKRKKKKGKGKEKPKTKRNRNLKPVLIFHRTWYLPYEAGMR